jgi:hypothetical protein
MEYDNEFHFATLSSKLQFTGGSFWHCLAPLDQSPARDTLMMSLLRKLLSFISPLGLSKLKLNHSSIHELQFEDSAVCNCCLTLMFHSAQPSPVQLNPVLASTRTNSGAIGQANQ